MKKILSPDEAVDIATKLNQTGKKIVLVGGCFDILHIGHITFFEKARQAGDTLFVFVESDETIKRLKGDNRPINNQQDRATILSSLSIVDYVICLPPLADDTLYDNLVIRIKPAIIATTAGDQHRVHKERQAQKIDAKVIDVISPIHNQSTTKLISLLNEL